MTMDVVDITRGGAMTHKCSALIDLAKKLLYDKNTKKKNLGEKRIICSK